MYSILSREAGSTGSGYSSCFFDALSIIVLSAATLWRLHFPEMTTLLLLDANLLSTPDIGTTILLIACCPVA